MKALALVAAIVTFGFTPVAHAQDASKLGEKWVEAYNAGNAAGVSALFTSDAVFIPASGVVLKKDQIENAIAGRIKAGWNKETVSVTETHDVGSAVWAYGDYTIIGSGENAGKQLSGKFGEVLVKDGNDWKIALLTANAAPAK